jgi:tetratricopeptide (TPR) repeat protein
MSESPVMMKLFSTLLCGVMLMCSVSLSAQMPENLKTIDKLKLLFEEGKFLKLEFKCYNLSMHDDIKKEPLLYLYWSLANYQISQDAQYLDEYPKAYKDAVKYGVKYRAKDKKKQFQEVGKEHLVVLHGEALTVADSLYGAGNFKKARSRYKTVVKIDPTDHYAQFMRAYCELEMKLTNDARVTFEEGMKRDGAQEGLESLGEKERARLKEEFLSAIEEDTSGDGTSAGRRP